MSGFVGIKRKVFARHSNPGAPDPVGEHPARVRPQWRSLRAKVGMEAYTLHDLRHCFASGLIADCCDVVTVQHALGYSSASITLNVYSHLWPRAEDRTMAAAAHLMAITADSADSARTLASI